MEEPKRPNIIRQRLLHYVSEYERVNLKASVGQRNSVQKYTCQVWPDANIRHICIGWLFRIKEDSPILPIGTKELNDSEIMALKMWVGAAEFAGVWLPRSQFALEAAWIEIEATKEPVALPPIPKIEVTSYAIGLGGTIVDTEPTDKEEDEFFSCE